MILRAELTTATSITMHLTLEEMYRASLKLREIDGGITMDVITNGCDVVDYYIVRIEFGFHPLGGDAEKNRNEFLAFVTGGTQQSNFGGVQEHEYWLS